MPKCNKIQKHYKEINGILQNLKSNVLLYVNYPFCLNHCKFCIYKIYKFNKISSNNFLKYYKKEIDLYFNEIENFKFKDIHVGGGTPNLVPPEQLIAPISKLVDFNNVNRFVVEVFPRDDLSEYIKELKKYHVTKIILGIQTLNNKIRKSENRIVSTRTIIKCLEVLSISDLIWSVDLVYGLREAEFSKDHLSELKKILQYNPTGIHLYLMRYQKENRFCGITKGDVNKHLKFKKYIDFQKVEDLLRFNNYKQIGDEWCLNSNEVNKNYAFKNALCKCEPLTIGLGIGARSRTRMVKYRNTKNLNLYTSLLKDGQFPIDTFFNYKNKLYLVANVLLEINESSGFDLKNILGDSDSTDREKQEILFLISYLKKNNVELNIHNNKIKISRSQWTKYIYLIERYLRLKGGSDYFYKN